MSELYLVLLPGLDGTGLLFKPFIDCLPEHIKPVVVSYPPDKQYGYEDLLPIVISSLPVGKKFIILGESFSGPLAVKAAHKKTEGLKGIILCATFASNPFRFVPSWFSFFSVSPIYHFWPLTIKMRALFSNLSNKELIHETLKAVRTVKPGVIAKRVKSILNVNVEKELRECPVPVLYIESTKDHLIKEHNKKRILSIRKDVRVAQIDTSHFVLQLAPHSALNEINSFIDTL